MKMNQTNYSQTETDRRLRNLWLASIAEHRVLPEYVELLVHSARPLATFVLDRMIVVGVTLPNGFFVTDYAFCVDAANFDLSFGTQIALKKVRDLVYVLEGYRLMQHLRPVTQPFPELWANAISSRKLSKEYVSRLVHSAPREVQTMMGCETHVSIRLPNNFTVSGRAAVINSAEYDKEKGTEIALQRIEEQVFMLEGYLLTHALYETN